MVTTLFRLFADVSQNITIHIEDVTVHGIRSMRSQEHSGATQLFRVKPTPCRSLGTDERIERMATAISLTFTQWSRLRSGDVAGTNAVALDVVFAILRTDVASQHLQTTLCCSISRHSLTSQFRHHGADVDNLAFTTLHHLRQHSAGADVGCHKVNVYHLLKLLTCHFMHRNTFDDASVVHKNVNLP